MKSICVFCGAALGKEKLYTEQAVQLARLFVKNNIRLIYGAGNVGLMGVMADVMIRAGGKVTGIIPEAIEARGLAHQEINKLIVVKDMAERKIKMVEMSDAFIVLPGGIGTLDELFEILSLNQLGYINKPCGLLNSNGYYNELLRFLENTIVKGFVQEENLIPLKVEQDPEVLLKRLMQ